MNTKIDNVCKRAEQIIRKAWFISKDDKEFMYELINSYKAVTKSWNNII